MAESRLRGRPFVITGGSRGIGRAIAIAAGAAGARVILTYKSGADEARETVRTIRSAGGAAEAHALDVAMGPSIAAFARALESTHGRIAVLVNNAGINKPTDFDKIEESDWDDILAVNLKGPFLVTQALLPLLRTGAAEYGDASVIHIGSVSGQYGGPRTAHYAASKAGLISLSQVIARFGAKDGVRSNTLAVGLVQSDMAAAGLQNAAVQKAAENILLRRLGTHDEVAEAALFLASSASKYVTAQTINVNGGLYF